MGLVRTAVCLSVILPLLLSSPAVWANEEGAAEQQRIAGLIEKLDDEQFATREAAEKHLLLLGDAAIDPIKAATKHHNAEVRYRAERVLAILSQRAIENYLQSLNQRIVGFLDRENDSLPGWDKFKALTGDDDDSRRLFAEMHRAEPRLLLTYCESPSKAGRELQKRLLTLQRQASQPMRLAKVSALLWIALDKDVAEIADSEKIAWVLMTSLHTRDFERSAATRHLVVEWINLPFDEDEANFIRSRITLAQRFSIKDKELEFAIQLMKLSFKTQKAQEVMGYRLQALFVFLNSGNASHVKYLELMLEDETVWPVGQFKFEMRDLALATILLLSDHDFADYKLECPKQREMNKDGSNMEYLMDLAKVAEEIGKRREEVLARWRLKAKQ